MITIHLEYAVEDLHDAASTAALKNNLNALVVLRRNVGTGCVRRQIEKQN